MKCCRIRVALITFVIGLYSVPFVGFVKATFTDLPKDESASPVAINKVSEETGIVKINSCWR